MVPNRIDTKKKMLEGLIGHSHKDLAGHLKKQYKTPPPIEPKPIAPPPVSEDPLAGLDEETLRKLLGG